MNDETVDDRAPETSPAERPQPRLRWLRAVVLGITGLFYAYAVWNAVAFLITYATSALGLNTYGWFVLLFAVVFPALVLAVAYALGRGRKLGEFSLVLVTGLGVVAVFWMNIVAYATLNLSSFVP
ncbi:MAG: bacitracin resistance protein [Actinomycetota bacterium]